jgi:hypothetical protein
LEPSKLSIAAISGGIIERSSGRKISAEVVLVTQDEIKTVFKKDGWAFNWKKEYAINQHQLYKLVISGDLFIQGLLSIDVWTPHVCLYGSS